VRSAILYLFISYIGSARANFMPAMWRKWLIFTKGNELRHGKWQGSKTMPAGKYNVCRIDTGCGKDGKP
jgi:hypothetical protein